MFRHGTTEIELLVKLAACQSGGESGLCVTRGFHANEGDQICTLSLGFAWGAGVSYVFHSGNGLAAPHRAWGLVVLMSFSREGDGRRSWRIRDEPRATESSREQPGAGSGCPQ